jgi:5'-nucleotidase
MTIRALVTNDDGAGSTGLAALARAAQEAGLDVTVAAPSWDTSGSSCALTGVQEDGRLAIAACELQGYDGRCFAVDAAPAMITLVALRGGFGEPPDLVLSGVNRGRNTGRAIIHSGTVGAALTAVNHGFAGMAISLDADAPEHWATAVSIGTPLIEWIAATCPPLVVNVNVPDRPIESLQGVCLAPLASIGAIQTNVSDASEGFLQMTYEAVVDEPEPGSDADLLRDGWVTVSAIQPLAEVPIDLPELLIRT